jgi:hypothetical protein
VAKVLCSRRSNQSALVSVHQTYNPLGLRTKLFCLLACTYICIYVSLVFRMGGGRCNTRQTLHRQARGFEFLCVKPDVKNYGSVHTVAKSQELFADVYGMASDLGQ